MENEFENQGITGEPEYAVPVNPQPIQSQPEVFRPVEPQPVREPEYNNQVYNREPGFYGNPETAPRFQPTPQYRQGYQIPYQPKAAPKVKKAKKSGKGWKTVLCVFLAIVLAVGSSAAGAYVGIQYMKSQQNDADAPAAQNPGSSSNRPSSSTSVVEGDRPDVNINVDKVDTSTQMTPADIYEANVNSTVGITTSITTNYWGYTTTSAASGSGFVYSADGYIITNYHVIEGASSITVSLYDGTSLDAKLIGYDQSNDVAVLKVEHEGLQQVVLGDSDQMRVGDTVLAIGNPLGELTFSLTCGAVSALDREVTFSDGITMNLIQTDCAINSGNSGGALFNLYGEVIGITNAKYSGNSASGASIDNIGFAIPMNQVRALVDSIIEKGYVVKPYIGVTVTDVSEEAQGYGAPVGASIQGVVEDSPAEKAGLKKSDIITRIDDTQIGGASDLKSYISECTPGDVLILQVWRRGQVEEIELTVGEQIQEATQQQQQQQSSQSQTFPGFGWG